MKRALCGSCGVVALSSMSFGAFTGAFAPSEWTLETFGDNAFIQQHDANTLVYVGPDASSSVGEFSEYFVTVPGDGTISFDWSWSGQPGLPDADGLDAGGWFTDGLGGTTLSDVIGSDSGSVGPVGVFVGETFGFVVDSADGFGGPGTLTITNFRYVPGGGAVSLLGVGGIFAARRRRD